jgi:hypothetical protein
MAETVAHLVDHVGLLLPVLARIFRATTQFEVGGIT